MFVFPLAPYPDLTQLQPLFDQYCLLTELIEITEHPVKGDLWIV